MVSISEVSKKKKKNLMRGGAIASSNHQKKLMGLFVASSGRLGVFLQNQMGVLRREWRVGTAAAEAVRKLQPCRLAVGQYPRTLSTTSC